MTSKDFFDKLRTLSPKIVLTQPVCIKMASPTSATRYFPLEDIEVDANGMIFLKVSDTASGPKK